VTLKYSIDTQNEKDEGTTTVHVSNPSEHLAFLVHLRLTRGAGGHEILPVLWDDNYFELLPGESRYIKASYWLRDLGKDEPELEVSGWNVTSAAPN
jgi:exo-1,4-beta-D-glucosaminidase